MKATAIITTSDPGRREFLVTLQQDSLLITFIVPIPGHLNAEKILQLIDELDQEDFPETVYE
jgi:hypothetical protein